jgi:hypothetical protein
LPISLWIINECLKVIYSATLASSVQFKEGIGMKIWVWTDVHVERLRGNRSSRTGRISGWAGLYCVFRSDLCLLTEFTLNGAISARCGHFIQCLYHMIPNLHIYYIIIPHFLLHMITSIANSNLFSNTRLICSVQWRYWDENMGHLLLFSVTHPTPPTDSSLTLVSQSFSQSFFLSYSHTSSPNLKFLSCSCCRIGRRARGQGCNRIHTNNTCKLINISPVRLYLWCIMGRQLNRRSHWM